jgi:hypothetical protein
MSFGLTVLLTSNIHRGQFHILNIDRDLFAVSIPTVDEIVRGRRAVPAPNGVAHFTLLWYDRTALAEPAGSV